MNGEDFKNQEETIDNMMTRVCSKCTIPWEECPATSDCPHFWDLLAHPETGCEPVE
jgi:hypothetical protein